MKLKWMKGILHTIIKALRLIEYDTNIMKHLLQKEDCLIRRYVLSLQYRDSNKNIKLWKAIINRFIILGKCLESKSFVMLDGSNSYNELIESKNCTKKSVNQS